MGGQGSSARIAMVTIFPSARCALAVNGQAAAPPTSRMNSRRFTRSPDRRQLRRQLVVAQRAATMSTASNECPCQYVRYFTHRNEQFLDEVCPSRGTPARGQV